jgi:hypothetical protein
MRLFKKKPEKQEQPKYREGILPSADSAISRLLLSEALLQKGNTARAQYFLDKAREAMSQRPSEDYSPEQRTAWQGAIEMYNAQARKYQDKLEASLIELKE